MVDGQREAMIRYCRGDETAFPELYRSLAPRVLRRIRALVRSPADAEDVLQNTFLKLHCARGTFLADAPPTPWLLTIAEHACVDELRRRGRQRTQACADLDGLAPAATLAGQAEDVAGERWDDRQRTTLLAALERLPPKQREAVVLTKIRGKSVREAAHALGTSETAVKLRAHRAYTSLRAILVAEPAFADHAGA